MAKKTPSQTSPAESETDSPDTTPERTVLDNVQITDVQIANWFKYHKPDDEAVDRIQRIRTAAGALAQIIKDNTPNCADQAAALRHVRDAMMTANASIVCRGR